MSQPQLSTSDFLTPLSVERIFQQIHSAKTARATEIALLSAAHLLQRAAAAGQQEDDFNEALDQVGDSMLEVYEAVLDRAVSFRHMEDGSLQAFWLLPVNLAIDNPRHVYHLNLSAPAQMQLSKAISASIGLETLKASRGSMTIMPILLSSEVLVASNTVDLINFWTDNWDSGAPSGSSFCYTIPDSITPGPVTYGIPVMTRIPKALVLGKSAAKADLREVLLPLVSAALNLDPAFITACPQAVPFQSFDALAAKIRLEVFIKGTLAQLCSLKNLEPQALTALVACYHSKASDEPLIGVTFVDRLSGSVLGVFSEQIYSITGAEELAQVHHLLVMLGISHVTVMQTPIKSCHCQACGALQFSQPPVPVEATIPVPDTALN